MASNDSHISLVDIRLLVLCNESISTNNVQSRHTKQLLGVINSMGLQHLSENRHSGVHWVTNDQKHGIGARSGARLCQTLYDSGVGVEKIVSGHSRLSWDTRRDNDDVATF